MTVDEPERRRAERLTWVLCAIGSALLALFHTAGVAILLPDGPPAQFLPALAGYGAACLGWSIYTGRLLGPDGDPRELRRRTSEFYRGSIVILPAITLTAIGGLIEGHWRPGGVALMLGGMTLIVVGFVVGAAGRPRRLMPRPLREGWPEIGTGALPHLYPGFVAHVLWLRRLRTRLVGGDPDAPLGSRRERPSWLDDDRRP